MNKNQDHEIVFTEKMLQLRECRRNLSTDAYCLAHDIFHKWKEENMPNKLAISFNLAVSYGYTGSINTFAKSLDNLVSQKLFKLEEFSKASRFIVFN